MYVLPVPKSMIINDGYFYLNDDTKIILAEECNFNNLESARVLQGELTSVTGLNIRITKSFENDCENSIFINKSCNRKESYELSITPNVIIICGGDDAGLFYGVQTLRQIVRTSGRKLKCVKISDNPYFGVRGFYHDVARGKIPTLDTLKHIADIASFYKLNQLHLYIEHTFAFKNRSEAWSVTDPITAEEILYFDEYCRKRHIELVPSLSTFGHMYEVLKTYSFNHLCELGDSLDTEFKWTDRMAHHTVDVSNEDSIRFIKESIDEFVPLFTSDKFNICADETFDLGKGKSKELAEKVGKGRLYIDFLKKIMNVVKFHGKKVMFWGDVLVSHPELMKEIDRDVICLDWDYAPEPYRDLAEVVKKNDMKQYMCTGVWGWNSLMNKMDMAYSNISNFTDTAVEYGAEGMLNTDWGDYGHINLLSGSIPGMAIGAAFSWNPDKKDSHETINRKISKIHFMDEGEKLIGLLTELSMLQVINYGEMVSWQERDYIDEKIKNLSEQEMHSMYNRAAAIKDEISDYAGKMDGENRKDINEYVVSAEGICLINSLALIMKKHIVNMPVERLVDSPKDLAVKFEYWFEKYKEVWRARNKESELYRIRNMIIKVCKSLRKIV